MENGEQRRWGSSEPLSSVRRSQSMSAAHSKKTPKEAFTEQTQRVRPMSSMSSRPESRASRPVSRTGSRLGAHTPLGGDTQESLLPQRPKSGTVRPLSGRVFLRRTSDKGWVAKHYPQAVSQNQELDIFDDLSDCDSLDSFFDDDFDNAEQEDKLQDLLSCNTLGVETKGTKPDWVSGEVGIPTFHCPRCRDQWYGITPFPCDEELARMIREGQWHTGKGEPGDTMKQLKDPLFRNRPGSSTSSKRDHSNSNSAVSLTKLPGVRSRYAKRSEKDDTGSGDGENSKKKKKRITFKLDLEDSDSSGPSSAEGELKSGGGSKGILRATSDGSGEDGLGTSTSGGGGSQASKDRGSGRNSGGGMDADDLLNHGRRKKGRSSHDLEDSSDGSGLLDDENKRRGKRLKHRTDSNTGGSGDGRSSGKADTGFGGMRDSRNQKAGNGTANGDGIGDAKLLGMDSERNKTGSRLDSGYSSARLGSNTAINGMAPAQQKTYKQDETSSESGSNTSLASSTRSQGTRRETMKTTSQVLGNKAHGRNIRKVGGYMRAVSPTSSEWGDPLHARSFISSTATSRAGSTANLLRDEFDDDNEGGATTLPPIVPPIYNKKPVLDLSDLFDGFQLTRPWTFSYHSSGPLTAKLTQRM